jgi:anti-sigma-K factor RskA
MNPQLEELACLYVLDRLEASERASFEACLLHNPQLAALVGELESALAQRIHALAQLEPPACLLAQIEARIDRLPAMVPPAPAHRATPLWPSLARWGIAALLAVGVGAMALHYLRRVPAAAKRPYVIIVGLDSRQSTLAELPMPKRSQDADACFIQLASLAERFWERPEDLPVKLRSTAEGGRGYALFDPTSNQGFIAIRQLPAIEQGQRYHLWILDTASGQTREAGVLPLTDSNRGLYFFSVAPASEATPGRLDFFVTAEDTTASQSTGPRGKVVLGDKTVF